MADVVTSLFARGVIVRRPRIVGALDRLDADRSAVRRMQRLRSAYGEGPVVLRLPLREVALILSPGDVHRVLNETPEPFATANREKRAALSHFQPHGVLISHGPERADRRRFNEDVLDTDRPVHSLGETFAAKIAEEVDAMQREAAKNGSLDWDVFARGWWRMVRRVVLGDGARDDHELTDMLTSLRRDANWAYLKPRRKRLRARFLEALERYVRCAEVGSLASLVATAASTPATHPVEQIPQWLFAFDAAGMASFRALALLAAHPDVAARAAAEPDLMRECVLESIRLWPTTPAILRDTTTETSWATGTLSAGTAVVIFAPFFHRDGERLSYADVFYPELWATGGQTDDWPLVPFSEGPGQCPGRNLVLLTASSTLAQLTAAGVPRQIGGRVLDRGRPLPGTFSPFRLRFTDHATAATPAGHVSVDRHERLGRGVPGGE
jgi:cytochrome P450